MKYISTLVLLFTFFCVIILRNTASAQAKYLPGYVVLNTGDTLKGFIETGDWRKAPETIHFKSSSGELHTYTPLIIRSFRIKNGEWYFSYAGDIDPSSLNDNELNYDPTPDTTKALLFIRAVIIGKASLYYARDNNDRIHLFLQKDGGIISELKYKKYYKDELVVQDYRTQITRRAIMSNQLYKEQIINTFSDCPYVSMRILDQPISYSKNDIMKVVIDYNRCKNARVVYKEEKEKWKFQVSVNGGINYSSISFKSDSNTYVGESVISNSVGFAAGIGLNCILPRTRESWSIYNEVMVKNFTSSGITGSAPFKEQAEVTMDLLYVKLLTMIRYQFPGSMIKPFLNAGMSNGLAIKDENLVLVSTGIPENFLHYFRHYEQGVIAGAGLNWKKLSVTVRFELSNGMSDYSNVKSNFTTTYALVGYRF